MVYGRRRSPGIHRYRAIIFRAPTCDSGSTGCTLIHPCAHQCRNRPRSVCEFDRETPSEYAHGLAALAKLLLHGLVLPRFLFKPARPKSILINSDYSPIAECHSHDSRNGSTIARSPDRTKQGGAEPLGILRPCDSTSGQDLGAYLARRNSSSQQGGIQAQQGRPAGNR